MSEQNGSSSPARKTSRRGWIIAGSIVGVLALLVGAKTLVYAHDGGWRHGDFADHIEDHVKYMLSDVAATPEQEAQVTSILQSTASDVHTLRDQHLSAHKQLHEILSAETIDRARLEAVRVDQLRLADEASKRIVQGVADAAEVLTPQQRTELVARLERHRHWQDD